MIIKIGFINEMNVPILAQMPAHGRSFEKDCFLSHSKYDCSFENLFKILVFTIEMNVPILAKMSAHGRSFEKFSFLLHSKDVPILNKMPAHIRTFDKVFYTIS